MAVIESARGHCVRMTGPTARACRGSIIGAGRSTQHLLSFVTFGSGDEVRLGLELLGLTELILGLGQRWDMLGYD